MFHRDDYISASEIGDYVYCQRAWWLRRMGVKPSNPAVLEQGTEGHEELAQQVQQAEHGRQLGQRLLWVGMALLILFVLLKLFQG